MSTRIFALIIGIDSYRSSRIRNLHSCVDDAIRVKRWLVNDLDVPEDHICLLLDGKATKRSIEDGFMEHFTNNPAIQLGDAILVYFAGHGSTILAPPDWFSGASDDNPGTVEVLCTYDHDTKDSNGRIAGISARSVHAMISDLSKVKGDNITFILDCCFSPIKSPANIRERGHTRWSPTIKATEADLYRGIWNGARGLPSSSQLGLFQPFLSSFTLLAACGPGDVACEGNDGGRFTASLLTAASELALHRTSYAHLIDHLLVRAGESQRPVCLGQHKSRILFNDVPFVEDVRFLPVAFDLDKRLKVQIGAIHGVVEGSELSLHLHNYRYSRNPSIANVVVSHVNATWCYVEMTSQGSIPESCWGQVTKWNNRSPFRVNFKATFTSFFSVWKLRRGFSTKVGGRPPSSGLNLIRVQRSHQADISLAIRRRSIVVERYDDVIGANCRRVVKIRKKSGCQVLDDAARFHLHLYRNNAENPYRNLVQMELYRLDSTSWTRAGNNLLHEGKATIPYEQNAVFTVVIRNQSQTDLWPYLTYMDANSYDITMLYYPPPSKDPPLPKHGNLEIGSGKPGSEAISFNFALAEHEHLDSGFLKVFLSTAPVSMGIIHQESFSIGSSSFHEESIISSSSSAQAWDTDTACLTFIRHCG